MVNCLEKNIKLDLYFKVYRKQGKRYLGEQRIEREEGAIHE